MHAGLGKSGDPHSRAACFRRRRTLETPLASTIYEVLAASSSYPPRGPNYLAKPSPTSLEIESRRSMYKLTSGSPFVAARQEIRFPHTGSANVNTTSSGLQYEDLQEGTGDVASSGQSVEVHYTGWLTNGTKFDSSLDRGKPFGFKLGAGQVIKGWDEGVAGMKVGGKRKLQIPAALAYGSRGAGGVIPPNAELVFDVELLRIK